jgi:type I restriction enzyme R subunit
LPLIAGKVADKAAETALEALRDEEKRQSFYSFFKELEDLYEILSPDPFLREFMGDYQQLADLYALLHSAYDGKGVTDRELARKTAYLVQEHTQASVIRESVSVYEITPQTLGKIAQSSQSDTVKVFNLLKSIGHKVQGEATGAPYLFSIGERAEAIAEAFKQRQISTQEALKQLEDLIHEINEAEREQAERGISGEPFAILWLLKQQGASVSDAEKTATQMAGILDEYPHWQISDKQARQVRRKLYQSLEQANIKNIPQIVEKIMSVIQRK